MGYPNKYPGHFQVAIGPGKEPARLYYLNPAETQPMIGRLICYGQPWTLERLASRLNARRTDEILEHIASVKSE